MQGGISIRNVLSTDHYLSLLLVQSAPISDLTTQHMQDDREAESLLLTDHQISLLRDHFLPRGEVHRPTYA